MKARAIESFNVTESDSSKRYFVKDKMYRAIEQGDKIFLIDENKYGYRCSRKEFNRKFCIEGSI